MSPGLSVASVAREHVVNANKVFCWRKLYRAGQLGNDGGAEQQVRLLPVSVSDAQPAETEPEEATNPVPGVTINIEFPAARLSPRGRRGLKLPSVAGRGRSIVNPGDVGKIDHIAILSCGSANRLRNPPRGGVSLPSRRRRRVLVSLNASLLFTDVNAPQAAHFGQKISCRLETASPQPTHQVAAEKRQERTGHVSSSTCNQCGLESLPVEIV